MLGLGLWCVAVPVGGMWLCWVSVLGVCGVWGVCGVCVAVLGVCAGYLFRP